MARLQQHHLKAMLDSVGDLCVEAYSEGVCGLTAEDGCVGREWCCAESQSARETGTVVVLNERVRVDAIVLLCPWCSKIFWALHERDRTASHCPGDATVRSATGYGASPQAHLGGGVVLLAPAWRHPKTSNHLSDSRRSRSSEGLRKIGNEDSRWRTAAHSCGFHSLFSASTPQS